MTRDLFNRGIPEGEGEAYIDGTWVVAHVAMRPELLAVYGLLITKFGEDSIGMTFKLIPGTIKRFESLSLRLGIAMKAGMWLAPAAMERATLIARARLPQGRQVIEEAGGIEAYDQGARKKHALFSATDELLKQQALKHSDKITFKSE